MRKILAVQKKTRLVIYLDIRDELEFKNGIEEGEMVSVIIVKN